MKFFIKFISLFLFVLFFNNLNAEEKIAYVDMNFLLNSSEAGKSITDQLTAVHKKNISNLKIIEDELKKNESDLLKQKNVISEEEFNKKIFVLRNKAKDYQKLRKESNEDLNKKRTEFQSGLINIIHPILANYASENSISIIFQKRNIIIGKTELDITKDILNLLDKKIKKISID